MGSAYTKTSPIGAYLPLHITANGTTVPVGLCVSTTAPTTITGGGTLQAVTPASMAGIEVGRLLNIANGTGTAEDVRVASMTATTFSAVFQNAHSGAYTIISERATFLGPIIVGLPGTSAVLTLYNGHPSNSVPGTAFAVVTVAAATSLPFDCLVQRGLFYTLASSAAPDLTLQYADEDL